MKTYLQKKFIRFLVKHLFNTVSKEDIFSQNDKDQTWSFEGRILKKESVLKLQEDADRFSKSVLWRLLKKELLYNANVRMYEKGTNTSDILAGKMLLYLVDVIDRTLKEMNSR